MSFSYWWFSCLLNDADYQCFASLASETAIKAESSKNLPPYNYEKLGEKLITSDFLTESTCFRFIITSRCSAAELLEAAIGHEKATLLPGQAGNLWLPAAQVSGALAQVTDSMYDLDIHKAVERGMEYAGHSNSEADVLSIITHLPEGLALALQFGKNFVAISRPQL